MNKKELLIEKSNLGKNLEHVYNDIELKILCFKREFACRHVANPGIYAKNVWQDWIKFKQLYQDYRVLGEVHIDFSEDREYKFEIEDNLVSHIEKKIDDMYLDLIYDVRSLLFNAMWAMYEHYEREHEYVTLVHDDVSHDIDNQARRLVLRFAQSAGIDCLNDDDFNPYEMEI